MIEACHNCGNPWLESYGDRCLACGAITGLIHEGIPIETPEEAALLDAIESHNPDPQPSAGEAEFFGVIPEGESHA